MSKSKVSHKKQKNSHKKEDSSFSFKDFDKKKIAFILPIIFILIASIVAFELRSGPADLDGLYNNVERNVYNQVEQIIRQSIEDENTFQTSPQRDRLVKERLDEVRKTGILEIQGQRVDMNAEIDNQFRETKQFFQTDDGYSYLVAIDPYFFFKTSENVLEHGFPGDTIIEDENGTKSYFVSKQLAPQMKGVNPKIRFQHWVTLQFYNLHNIDENSSYGEKLHALYFIEVFFAILAIIPVFFIIRRFSNDITAFGGSLLLASLTMFATRTVAGFVDTDAFTVFFPATIACFFIYALTAKKMWTATLFSILAGFFTGVGLWAWRNNWFIVLALLSTAIGYLVYLFVIDYLETKTLKISFRDNIILLTTGVFIIASFIFNYILRGSNLFVNIYEAVFRSLDTIAGTSAGNIWPNVLSSVAELNPASFNQIVSSVGGQVTFILALTGLLFLALNFKTTNTIRYSLLSGGILWIVLMTRGLFQTLTQNQELLFLILLFLPIVAALIVGLFIAKNRSQTVFVAALLTLWMAGTIFMSFNGVRFILLMSPAFAISFGISLYFIVKELQIVANKVFEIPKGKWLTIGTYIIIIGTFFLIWMPIYGNTMQATSQQLPSFDDAWHETMFEIRDNSDEDAIITSWWDFGHFFHAVADRGVTFDGASQTTPQSHWVGKLLLEENEQVSKDILRMLVCGGNQAFEEMQKITNDSGVKINKLIYQTLGQDIQTTRDTIQNNNYFDFTEEQTNQIMQYLACETPRENFVITSEDMVGKAPVWSHWGLWDFTKKYVHDNRNRLTPQQLADDTDSNITEINQYLAELQDIDARARRGEFRRSDAINQWFSPYSRYHTNSFQSCQQRSETEIVCLEGITINTQTNEVQQNPQLPVKRLIYVQEDSLEIHEQADEGIDLVIRNTNQALAADYPHGSSLFTRLFFLDGIGVDNFEKFSETRSLTTGKITVWKTIWD